MSKGVKPAAGLAAGNRDVRREVRRLERRLAAVREVVAKRDLQAAKARDRGVARDLQSKRMRQLDKALRRSAALGARLAMLSSSVRLSLASDGPAPAAAAALVPAAGPMAYCLRERRSVAIADPSPIVMRNGRTGVAGTCPGCGARLVRPR
jgi:Domain of unknown function (DUF5679)